MDDEISRLDPYLIVILSKSKFFILKFPQDMLIYHNYQRVARCKTSIGRFMDQNELIVRGLGLFDSPLLAPRPLSLSPHYFALLIYK